MLERGYETRMSRTPVEYHSGLTVYSGTLMVDEMDRGLIHVHGVQMGRFQKIQYSVYSFEKCDEDKSAAVDFEWLCGHDGRRAMVEVRTNGDTNGPRISEIRVSVNWVDDQGIKRSDAKSFPINVVKD